MRINPFLNLKSSAAGGEGCSGDCGKGERECSGSWCFSDAKVLLDYYRELRFYFRPPWICNWMRLVCPPMLFQGWMGRWCGGKQLGKREMFSAYLKKCYQ